MTLPTPVPATLRVAAPSTNIGWAPGAVTMTASEYAQACVSALTSRAIVTAAAAAIIAIPGYIAAGVAPAVALQD